MTKEDLIAMARQAGCAKFVHERNGVKVVDETNLLVSVAFVERFAKLIEARTREECAVACEAGIDEAMEAKMLSKSQRLAGKDGELEALKFWSTVSLYNNARKLCAASIRAMGERT